MRGWTLAAFVLAMAGATLAPGIALAKPGKAASMLDCFADLARGKGTEIVCEFPIKPSDAERAEMEKQTAGYLKDAICTVSIRIERALVMAAVETPDYQFQAPPQPVACNVTMPGKAGDQIIPIGGTFAPLVTIQAGVATMATPGLGGITGVSRLISVPVTAYINRAGFLREGMLKTVNVWLVHLRTAKAHGR